MRRWSSWTSRARRIASSSAVAYHGVEGRQRGVECLLRHPQRRAGARRRGARPTRGPPRHRGRGRRRRSGAPCASTLSTSTDARGSTSRGSAADPRRSMRRITPSSLGIRAPVRSDTGCEPAPRMGEGAADDGAAGGRAGGHPAVPARHRPRARSRAAAARLRAALPPARAPTCSTGREDDRGFGVVAIREGREVGEDGVQAMYEVGTLAVVREVRPLPRRPLRRDRRTATPGSALLGLADAGTPYLVRRGGVARPRTTGRRRAARGARCAP